VLKKVMSEIFYKPHKVMFVFSNLINTYSKCKSYKTEEHTHMHAHTNKQLLFI